MKSINILSLIQAYISLSNTTFEKFLNYYEIYIKNDELQDIKLLIDKLCQFNKYNVFNSFFVGFKIPQIGKEFDLLRFGHDYIINLELKKNSSNEKIEKQLKRNKYYLSYLETLIYHITFISDSGKLYLLSKNDYLEEIDFPFLISLLSNQTLIDIDNPDILFNPSNYLVSPFNSTDKFLENKYFLTNQQERIKNKIIELLDNTNQYTFVSVTGSAGTGKTLLIYDIYKKLKEKNKIPLIIHCGYLNHGQNILNGNGWKIIPVKDAKNLDLGNFDAIIIDETQRIYIKQLSEIIAEIKSKKLFCIFSYDNLQTLSSWEVNNDINSKINNIDNIIHYKLTTKIRTNKEISIFIKSLFNKKRNFKLINNGNIIINYFKNIDDAKHYLNILDRNEWNIIRFTPSRYNKEHHNEYSDISNPSSHSVIGQEFDNVAVTIDKYFSYDINGSLIYKDITYYHPVKMLFQNITRTRLKLDLIIIDNEEILERCISILNQKTNN